jgi:Flp pilus assembly protein TadG
MRFIARLRADERGSTVIEFAILAPTLFMMMFGVLAMGLRLSNANALQSVGADTARWTMVEYQKANKEDTESIEDQAKAYAVNTPYNLDINRLTVSVTSVTTDVVGTSKLKIYMTYTPFNPLEFAGLASPQLKNTRYVYVDD